MQIAIEQISKSFGRKVVLDQLSFTADSGRCVGILGENGSGKSTLFSILTGLQKGAGAFWCDGVDLLKNPKLRMKTVGFVPQNPPLIPELTAYDNLLLWYTRPQLLAELNGGKLAMLGIHEFLKVPVAKMSGGMKKRLAIGCAIAHDPQILLLDEPSSALDLVCREQIYAYLRSFSRRGGITLMATHEIYELGFCDDVYLLKGGRLSRYEGDRQLDELIRQLKNA
jgi:ABC-2 type transport system ATP-binding protein